MQPGVLGVFPTLCSYRMSRDDAWPNLVGLAAYGLWKRMQAVMEVATPRGHLRTLTGDPITVSDLARLVGETPAAVKRLLERLASAKVYELRDGVVIDLDMVRRAQISAIRSENGRRGAEQTNRQRPKQEGRQMPQQTAGEPQQTGTVAAANAASAAASLVGTGSSSSAVEPSTTTTSAVRVRVVPPEIRQERLDHIKRHRDVKELAVQLPSDGDRDLLYAMLVQVSLAGGPGGARGIAWLTELRDMLNPQRMHGQPVSAGILAQAIRDYGANGFLDDEADPKPAHFQAFVEFVRSGVKPPVRGGRRQGQGIASKVQGAYDTSGNTGAADRLTREMDN